MSEYVKHTKNSNNYIEQDIIVNNAPHFGDKGEHFLHDVEDAIEESYKYLEKGYRLMSFTAYPERGVKLVLRKNK
ncbi:MAG: hypothetical protein H0Z40_08970 [Desulfotomaculum sp.]|nr:hypothetical protein [Desulfotomaculum sp.]